MFDTHFGIQKELPIYGISLGMKKYKIKESRFYCNKFNGCDANISK